MIEGFPIHRSGVWPLVTGPEMQALDRQTIAIHGISGEILMESAGRALARPALELRASGSRANLPIRAICGAGNNGGDGFVLARHLHADGIPVEAILVGDPLRLPRDALVNWNRLAAVGVPRRIVDPRDEVQDWHGLLAETSVVVDALFGTGLTRDISGGLRRVIESIDDAHQAGLQILSVDIPSGICARTGQVLGAAVSADRTLAISLPKIGLVFEPGRSCAGLIDVVRIGIDDPDPRRLPRVEIWNARAAVARFPNRPRDGHKGKFGHVFVIGGSAGKTGAAALCARASLRAGAGLVSLAYPAGLAVELSGLCAEVMTVEGAATSTGGFSRTAGKMLVELAEARDVVALGPGLGRDPETAELVRELVISINRPLVLDADALFALGGELDLLHERSQPTILTPHPGEAGRLLDMDAEEINSDRIAAARRLAELTRSIVILKGAATVVAGPDGQTLVVPTGGPALAVAGTGDVLTGIVGSLLAVGSVRDSIEVAGLAAWWHGASADRLDSGRRGFGFLASEIADGLADCAEDLMRRDQMREPDADLVFRFPGS